MTPPLRACYFGTYRDEYGRNQIMIEGLRRNGVEVIECHETLWRGIQDRVSTASGGWMKPAFLFRVFRAYSRLLRAHSAIGRYDVMVVGYPGQFDVYLAHFLARRRGKPLVMDVFMSLALIAEERGLSRRHRLTARLLQALERRAYALPDLLIQDTREYVDWLSSRFGVSPARFRLVPTGADDRVFQPIGTRGQGNSAFLALYYGTFIPNHGVEHIVEAARLLRKRSDVHIELIGDGPTRMACQDLARRYELTNVNFVAWVDKSALPDRIAAADVCLGAFGTTPQSMMTVQNKIYEGLAMRKPVLTGDSPTIRASLRHEEEVYLCERANPESLAGAIRRLRDDPALRARIAAGGYDYFRQNGTIQRIGEIFRRHLIELLEGKPRA